MTGKALAIQPPNIICGLCILTMENELILQVTPPIKEL